HSSASLRPCVDALTNVHQAETRRPCLLQCRDEWLAERAVFEKAPRLVPGAHHQRMIADEVAGPQQRQSRLPRAEEISRAANLQIAIGNLEAVARVGQRRQPRLSVFGNWILIQQHAMGLIAVAPDAA